MSCFLRNSSLFVKLGFVFQKLVQSGGFFCVTRSLPYFLFLIFCVTAPCDNFCFSKVDRPWRRQKRNNLMVCEIKFDSFYHFPSSSMVLILVWGVIVVKGRKIRRGFGSSCETVRGARFPQIRNVGQWSVL